MKQYAILLLVVATAVLCDATCKWPQKDQEEMEEVCNTDIKAGKIEKTCFWSCLWNTFEICGSDGKVNTTNLRQTGIECNWGPNGDDSIVCDCADEHLKDVQCPLQNDPQCDAYQMFRECADKVLN